MLIKKVFIILDLFIKDSKGWKSIKECLSLISVSLNRCLKP